MNRDIIYVHLGTVENIVLSYGISAVDFFQSLTTLPKHLLLLTPVNYDELIDPHTSFNILSDVDAIKCYFNDRKIGLRKWIDYQQDSYLEEVTPYEVAELLYLSHTSTYLHSPFYYKLGNRFVYLDLPNGMNKTYYRYLERFYHVFNTALLRHIRTRENSQSWWLRLRQAHLTPLSVDIFNQLRSLMIQGIVFEFTQMRTKQGVLQIPLYYMSHLVINDSGWNDEKALPAGILSFILHANEWELSLVES